MRHAWRRRALVALAAVAAAAGAVEWGVRQISVERHRGLLERRLTEAVGREVQLGGDLHFELLPSPTFEAAAVRVAGPAGRAGPDLLRIDALRLGLALVPLLQRRLDVVWLAVEGGELALETDAEGRLDAPDLSWSSGVSSAPDSGLETHVRRVELRDVRVAHRDARSDSLTTLWLAALELSVPSAGDTIEWSAEGELAGTGFALAGKAGSLAELRDASRPWPVSFSGTAGDAELDVAGKIDALRELAGLDLQLDVRLPELGNLYAHHEPRLPQLGSARLRAHLLDAGGVRRVENLELETDASADLVLRIEGNVANLTERRGIDLAVSVDADRLDLLEPWLGRSLPDGTLSAKLSLSDRDGTLGARGEARAASRDPKAVWIQLEGSVGDLVAAREVDVEAKFGARSLAQLAATAGLPAEIPDLGRVSGRARLRDPGGRLGLERFSLEGGEAGVLTVKVSGSVRDLRQIDALTVDARLEARDLAVVGGVVGLDWPAHGPVRFEGRVSGSNEKLDSRGSAVVGASRFEGRMSGSFPSQGRPRVEGELRSAHVQLEDLGLAGAPLEPDARSTRPAPWRDTAPLPFERLLALDGSLAVAAERVTGGRSVDLRRAAAVAALEAGRLDVSRLELDYEGGRISGDLRIEAQRDQPRAGLRLRGIGVDLTRLSEAFALGDAVGDGHLDATLDLRGEGRSPAALLATVSGHAALALRDWTAESRYSSRFLVRLQETLFSVVSPRRYGAAWLADRGRSLVPATEAAPEPPGCLVASIDFERGVGRVDRLRVEGRQTAIDGDGTLDFRRDAWNLRLEPELRDAALFTMASAVRVTGPLDAPVFDPIPLDVAAGAVRGVVRGTVGSVGAVTRGALRPAQRLIQSGAKRAEAGARPGRAVCALPEPRR